MTLLEQGGWTRWSLEVPSNLTQSATLVTNPGLWVLGRSINGDILLSTQKVFHTLLSLSATAQSHASFPQVSLCWAATSFPFPFTLSWLNPEDNFATIYQEFLLRHENQSKHSWNFVSQDILEIPMGKLSGSKHLKAIEMLLKTQTFIYLSWTWACFPRRCTIFKLF